MVDLRLLLQGFGTVLYGYNLVALVLGSFFGIIIGAIPGLTATMGIALLVPFTFGMTPITGIVMLLGIYTGAIYGGGISAILIKTPGTPAPGTPAAAATVFDGYPMAQKGLAGKAIGIATISSGIGGTFTALCLAFFAPILANFALRFSAPEYFALATFGLSVTVTLSGRSPVKGFISGTLGLLISMIGLDPMGGFPRFTFGFPELTGGLSFVPMLIGLFALSEGFRQVEVIFTAPRVSAVLKNIIPTLKDLKGCVGAYLRACPIGLIVGITPAIGADTSAFLSYAETKRASKHPERFGTGEPAGVAAAQCGENASTGGDVLPMITLGIPGDAATAVLMGALTIHNLQPGPLLFQNHPETVHQIFAGMIAANVTFVILGLIFARFFAQVINVDRKYLVPLIFIACLVGSYAINNVLYDLVTCAIFGFLGYAMIRYDFPVAPMVLAQILGGMMESNYRRALTMSRGDPTIFLTRPITVVILALAAFTTFVAVRRQRQALRLEADSRG
ncbi:MAG: tripartite tricarboxylate transporter permease [candidate division NC10 bacterium]|nr:tripartite tricarboxylate transporter permease [candidate division NC10 bacterium]